MLNVGFQESLQLNKSLWMKVISYNHLFSLQIMETLN